MPGLLHEALTGATLGAFFEVYNTLGTGFLESVYEAAMTHSLGHAGIRVERQSPVTVYFRGAPMGMFRPDLIIADRLIVEIKVADRIHTRHIAQLLNALRATRIEVGLLLNFGPQATFRRMI